MLNPIAWQAYWRANPSEPWQWLSAGPFFTTANAEAMLRMPPFGELLVIYGRQTPQEYTRRWRLTA
jgi:hypothetical protein